MTRKKLTGIAGLSVREREALVLVVAGMSNKEIARAMRVAPTTVHCYIKSIFERLGINNRVKAAVAAVRAGIA